MFKLDEFLLFILKLIQTEHQTRIPNGDLINLYSL
jgi:hypothetical protein